MSLDHLFEENQLFLAIQHRFYYFLLCYLGWKLFYFFWSIYGDFITRWNFNIVTKIIFSMTCSETFLMTFESVSSNKLSSIYISSVFVWSSKGLFSSNVSSTKFIRSLCFFCSFAALSIALNFCSRSKNSLSSFSVSISMVSALWTCGLGRDVYFFMFERIK